MSIQISEGGSSSNDGDQKFENGKFQIYDLIKFDPD